MDLNSSKDAAGCWFTPYQRCLACEAFETSVIAPHQCEPCGSTQLYSVRDFQTSTVLKQD